MFKGYTCISINVLLEPIATVTSSERFCILQAVCIFKAKMARIGYILDLKRTTSHSAQT